MTKEIKITPPEGYIIDKENSTFECIKFKPKKLTYEDVAKELFKDNHFYCIKVNGTIISTAHTITIADDIYHSNNATSEKQLEKLLAINKLMNVAKYLNGDWKPDWSDKTERKYYICMRDNIIDIDATIFCTIGVYFQTLKFAQYAIDILGEDTIRLALSTDW